MKKSFLLGAILLTSLSLVGCAGKGEKVDTKNAQETSSEVKKGNQSSEEGINPDSKELPVSNTELKDSSKKIHHYIQTSFSKMKDIWPTADKNLFKIFITNGEDVYFTNEDKRVSKEDLTDEMKDIIESTGDSPGSFGKFTYEGKPAVMMVSEKVGNELKESEILRTFETGTHELFHTAQENWKNEERNSRSAVYPEDATPRKYRASMVAALRTAYHNENKKEESIEEFNYWYNKWTKEYPEEVQTTSSTDILEGTAEYFGMAMADKATNYNEVYKELEKLPVLVKVIPQIDAESYAIGFYAINILKDSNKLNTELMEQFKETPAEQLHKATAKPKKDFSMDKEIAEQIDDEINEKNESTKKLLGTIPDDYLKGKLSYLKVAPEMSNSVNFSAFVSVKDVEGQFGLNTQGGMAKGISATDATMLALPDGYLALPIDKGDIKENENGTLTVKSSSYEVSDNIKFKKSKDEFGNVVYEEVK